LYSPSTLTTELANARFAHPPLVLVSRQLAHSHRAQCWRVGVRTAISCDVSPWAGPSPTWSKTRLLQRPCARRASRILWLFSCADWAPTPTPPHTVYARSLRSVGPTLLPPIDLPVAEPWCPTVAFLGDSSAVGAPHKRTPDPELKSSPSGMDLRTLGCSMSRARCQSHVFFPFCLCLRCPLLGSCRGTDGCLCRFSYGQRGIALGGLDECRGGEWRVGGSSLGDSVPRNASCQSSR